MLWKSAVPPIPSIPTASVVIKSSFGVRINVSSADVNGSDIEKNGKLGSLVKSKVQVVSSSMPSPVGALGSAVFRASLGMVSAPIVPVRYEWDV
jgi:hypothetical protein